MSRDDLIKKLKDFFNKNADFYDIYMGKYMLIAAKKGLRFFILTCYITDTIKKGATLWEKK
ncbi:MAG: hypothetical protein NUV74_15070 [Candidatus Brocadiaceae bacterium]|nr:hypothetical protein [Candidatus Brocadiaceae bacterium]